MKWYSATEVARLLNVATATVISHCEDGTMPAINIARKTSKRRRYRISEEHLAEFTNRRSNRQAPDHVAKPSRHTIQRPSKDFFASPEPTKHRDQRRR
jgi:hypothetical protein